jgi:hypothetical protein
MNSDLSSKASNNVKSDIKLFDTYVVKELIYKGK